MKKILVFIVLIVVLLILIIGWFGWKGYKIKEEGATITTHKAEYLQGENPKIKITNDSREEICFSSCYPYYLEINEGGFESYQYGNCSEVDVVETCIKPSQIKTFEILLERSKTEKGLHRIAIPACIGCALYEEFRQDKWFYSNDFFIK
ncbi:MAG TPA: hypothetical protein ENI19_01555 [Candidatus Nealsonbacteria bacterium]|uniref:Uncharacterized protein n=1 Tax=marine sediment metagenome TaxID=412755 RepID=A0A0F9UJW9_9ZZZZ|nr:hypothetical protein [Candidatus Nealsonbacteria bacterium]HEB46379.1 hypothetical protein [Candidatus Nealsonbacteria bacterium]